ncbi:MAG: acyl-CoA synthetase [Neomegalonema sp.]|nr:acyl-CoA synthetase [Neomegalonema sp.]
MGSEAVSEQRAERCRPRFASLADKQSLEAVPDLERYTARSTRDMLDEAAARFGDKTALSFQLTGDPQDTVHTMSFAQLQAQVRRLANGLYAAGVQPGETIALMLPNLPETLVAILAAQSLGVVTPINPMLEPKIIAGILRETGATTLITLAPLPKTDIAQKAAEALRAAPGVGRVICVDLAPYLPLLKRLIVPLIRPKVSWPVRHLAWSAVIGNQPADRLLFQRPLGPQMPGAYFHTGGTTGTPKIAVHDHRCMVHNAWRAHFLLFGAEDVLICALPLFHVFGTYSMALPALAAGAHLVILTPSGFRGEGVVANFWKLIERYRCTFFAAVPTALAALDQRPVDADLSSLQYLFSGSAPLPQALFKRFEQNTGCKILEGYGLTETTSAACCNPPEGDRRIGSVGLPLPYTELCIATRNADGAMRKAEAADTLGEICFRGACVFPGFLEADRNAGIFVDLGDGGGEWLRTGDLGHLDPDGYLWITGRAKDVIIRGGHNIDPGMIEEALAEHPAVAVVGAIGQPDSYAGELPCAYVELREGMTASAEELKAFAAERVSERAARPVKVVIMPEIPKTSIGKTFKPALRELAIQRVLEKAMSDKGIEVGISVRQDPKLGMVALLKPAKDSGDSQAIQAVMDGYAVAWRLENQ